MSNESLLVDKLFPDTNHQAAQQIVNIYTQQGYGVVSYLYFANAMKWRLFEHGKVKEAKSQKVYTYACALAQSDILLPDGIALQVFTKLMTGRWVQNLNGTDFLPFFLGYLQKQHIQAEIIIYGAKPEYTQQLQAHYEQYFPVICAQHGYQEFDRSVVGEPQEGVMRIMLIGRGSPLQEIWAHEHLSEIQKTGCLVMNQGGTFDFIVGEETRAPERMVRARVLETFWRIATNPKKNLRKFWDMFGIFGYLWRRVWERGLRL